MVNPHQVDEDALAGDSEAYLKGQAQAAVQSLINRRALWPAAQQHAVINQSIVVTSIICTMSSHRVLVDSYSTPIESDVSIYTRCMCTGVFNRGHTRDSSA